MLITVCQPTAVEPAPRSATSTRQTKDAETLRRLGNKREMIEYIWGANLCFGVFVRSPGLSTGGMG